MKKIQSSLLAIVFFLGFHVSFAQSTPDLIDKLDRQMEIMLDSAAKHMVNFILTHKEVEYQTAVTQAKIAADLNNASYKKAYEQNLDTDLNVPADRSEELKRYTDLSLKTFILNEKIGEGNAKVKYQGKVYFLSDESKKLFYVFLSYLPRE